jgi:hypothetical protein
MWRLGGESEGSGNGVVADRVSLDALKPDGRSPITQQPMAQRLAYDDLRLMWLTVAHQVGLSQPVAGNLAARADQLGTSLPAEILANPTVSETDFYLAVGRVIGVAVCFRLERKRLHLNAREAAMLLGNTGDRYPIRYAGDNGATIYLTSPDPCRLDDLILDVTMRPEIRHRLVLVPRSVMRATLSKIARPALIAKARDRLFLTTPLLSARTLTNGWQGVLLGTLLICLPAGMVLQPSVTMLAIHIVATLFFMSGIFLRIAAIHTYARAPPAAAAVERSALPLYTVLVALRNEAAIVPELLVSLGKIRWPRSRLEIKFVCETDDRATIDAVKVGAHRTWVEVIEVPEGMLKTKPNALCFALPQTSGDFVVLYDAEDRPAPNQLIEAWRRFSTSDGQLACLQAPLRIDNWRQGILPRMFALEYASLFTRILPMLGRFRLVMPLGGTSNHFRGLM